MLDSDHSVFFYLLIVCLLLDVLQGFGIGGLFFFKRSGVKRANFCYAFLLLAFGSTLLHYMLLILQVYEARPRWSFIPLYFTLSFGPLLFYHVKFNLYPKYHWRYSDIKHFFLPLGQLVFFLVLFFSNTSYEQGLERKFFNPFYGAMEQFLFLTTFFAYLYFGYRYLQHKRREVRNEREVRRVLYLNKLLKGLFVLFCIHAFFVLTDFFVYELLDINLRSSKIFAALGILSFASLLFWMGTYGFQLLVWGRKRFA